MSISKSWSGVDIGAAVSGIVAIVMAGLTLLFVISIFATRLLPDLYGFALLGILAAIVTVPASVICAIIAISLGFVGRTGAGARRGSALGALSLVALIVALILHNILGS